MLLDDVLSWPLFTPILVALVVFVVVAFILYSWFGNATLAGVRSAYAFSSILIAVVITIAAAKTHSSAAAKAIVDPGRSGDCIRSASNRTLAQAPPGPTSQPAFSPPAFPSPPPFPTTQPGPVVTFPPVPTFVVPTPIAPSVPTFPPIPSAPAVEAPAIGELGCATGGSGSAAASALQGGTLAIAGIGVVIAHARFARRPLDEEADDG